MEFSDYQKLSKETAIYRETSPMLLPRIMYCALGLASEAGEVAGKAKRVIRDDGEHLIDSRAREIAAEIGDCLWYCAMLAEEIGYELDYIARHNIEKLHSRKERGVITGSGDTR